MSARMHATAIHWPGLGGVLLVGASGNGKSDLALRLLARGALLVADDQVMLTQSGGAIIASAPPPILGYLEARRIGIIAVPSIAAAALHVGFELVRGGEPARLPAPQTLSLPQGARLPSFPIDPFEASAPELVRAGLWHIIHNPNQSLPGLAGFSSHVSASC